MAEKPNIIIFVGEDDYLTDTAARKFIAASVPEDLRASAVETVSGEAANEDAQLASISSCRGSVETPPFLDPVKLTWWRNVEFLPGGGRGGKIPEGVKESLERFASFLTASPLPPNQFLVITATKMLKTSIFAKAFANMQKDGLAEVHEFVSGKNNRGRRANALDRLEDFAKAEKLSFEKGADEAFIDKVGFDTRLIVSELAKMRTYLGNERNKVTSDDVAIISSVGHEEPEFWDINDAIAARDVKRLMNELSKYLAVKDQSVLLSQTTETLFRQMVVCKEAIAKGWMTAHGTFARDLSQEVASDLDAAGLGPNTIKQWQLKRPAGGSQNYTMTELRMARWRMLGVREAVVSSDSADITLVVQELLRIVRRPTRT